MYMSLYYISLSPSWREAFFNLKTSTEDEEPVTKRHYDSWSSYGWSKKPMARKRNEEGADGYARNRYR